jgi:hypothetical protein
MKNDYEVKELKKAEIDCLRLLDYKLSHHSALFCLDYFLSNGVIWDNDDFTGDLSEFYALCYNILDFFIEDVRFVDFNPFQVSCAVISLVRDYYKFKEPWSGLMTKAYGVRLDEFMNCFIVIKR